MFLKSMLVATPVPSGLEPPPTMVVMMPVVASIRRTVKYVPFGSQEVSRQEKSRLDRLDDSIKAAQQKAEDNQAYADTTFDKDWAYQSLAGADLSRGVVFLNLNEPLELPAKLSGAQLLEKMKAARK